VQDKVDSISVGGLVAELLGHVPKAGASVDWNRLRFEVTKASSRRAERILVTVLDEQPKSSEQESV